uniref:Transcription factor 19 (SC1), like n=1 Tax=Tetraodon nigroviridis TaxID=99883 RepID=H3CHY7_TETNG
VQPCFQLLRIGSSDLYTFRPALSQSVFRLGRAAELCDVTLDSTSVSRIHAELHAQKETNANDVDQPNEGWTVHIRDRSTHGTWVNEVRLQSGVQWELSDGDTLTFGGQSAPGSSEFYFLFQRVRVRPLDFDAITIPKAGTFSSDLQDRIRTNLDRKRASNLDQSKLSINRATIILNSIGSLSKMKGSSWTFRRSHSHEGSVSDPGSSSSPPLAEASRSRRKSAHTVLLEDDSSDEPHSQRVIVYLCPLDTTVVEDGQRIPTCHRRRGRPRKHPLPQRPSLPSPSSSEPCAAPQCRLPQEDTVQWIQCDVCDAWYHIDCLYIDRKKLLRDPNADFHCGCFRPGVQF